MNSLKKMTTVIAGTPVDTEMGVSFIKNRRKNWVVHTCNISNTPQDQTKFQVSSRENKQKVISDIVEENLIKKINTFFVYCNSLSSVIDFTEIENKYDVKFITPLMIYEELSKNFNRIGVLAANNQSLAGIENAMMKGNPEIEVTGISLLPVVKLIEQKVSPSVIIENWKLNKLIDFFEGTGTDAIVLGCTHFPWFKEEFEKLTNLPVIDPAEMMLQKLDNYLNGNEEK